MKKIGLSKVKKAAEFEGIVRLRSRPKSAAGCKVAKVRPPKTLPKGDAPPNVQVFEYLEIDLGGFVLSKCAWA